MFKKTEFKIRVVWFVLILFAVAPLQLKATEPDMEKDPYQSLNEKQSDRQTYGYETIFINDKRVIAWSHYDWTTDTSKAFMYHDNKITPIGEALSDQVSIIDMNQKGNILFKTKSGEFPNTIINNYLYMDEKTIRLIQNDNENCFPTSMNDEGDIVGYCKTKTDNQLIPYLWNKKKRVALDKTLIDPNAYTFNIFINNKKQIALSSKKGAYFLENNQSIEIKPPDPHHIIVVEDFNDKGQIAGYVMTTSSFQSKAIFWENNVLTVLDGMGSYNNNRGTHINSQGQMIGYTRNNKFQYKPFLYDNDRLTDLSGGFDITFAYVINDKGVIAGTAKTVKHQRTISQWKNGNIHMLGLLDGAEFCLVSGINNKGQIIGKCGNARWTYEYFVWENGTFTNLTELVKQ